MTAIRRRRRESDAAAARIERAALSLFAARGFEGASTHAIARAGRATQGLIRHHFESKEGLWRHVVAREVSALRAELAALDARTTADSARAIGVLEPVAARRELVAVTAHALLEPGARREWLVREQLAPLWQVIESLLRSCAGGPWARARPSAASAGAWLAAGLAWPLFAPAFLGDGARESHVEQRDRHALLGAWFDLAVATLSSSGPWSLAARLPRPR